MKIALIGTHGTGKTTLAHDLVSSLSKEGYNADMLKEVVRDIPPNLPVNERLTKESAEWIMYTQYARELELERLGQILICDRSVMDAYVYYRNKFNYDLVMEEFAKEKTKTYKRIFKVPINKMELREDSFRSTNKDFQKSIDEKFYEVLRNLEVPYNEYKDLETALKIIKEDYASLKQI